MNVLELIRKGETGIVVSGNHPKIVQSILDFDYLSGNAQSVHALVTNGRRSQKFFWGTKEILIPCYKSFSDIPESVSGKISFLLNVQSGRRAAESTHAFFATFPHALGAHIFAENVPEAHATELLKAYAGRKILAGPSGVGVLVPGALKLGAIGGVDPSQLVSNKLMTKGSVAVISTSGGMTGELIHAVSEADRRLSFAFCIGGDRFPGSSLGEVLALAEADSETKGVAYFGELGGVDEYEIVELIRTQKLTKPVVAYIAGIIDESFDSHVQFGHAKALVAHKDESARAKREALREVGVHAADSFPEFLAALEGLPSGEVSDPELDISPLLARRASILSTREILNVSEIPSFVEKGTIVSQESGFMSVAVGALLGKELASPTSKAFFEAVGKLLIDHGGNVSGAVTSMITARAGKDLVSSLSAGLLTIGPRFGGAINDAAKLWMKGVSSNASAVSFVEETTRAGSLILGIGHKKYRVGIPDPRVSAIEAFTELLLKHEYFTFARAVEKVTTGKNGSLILNVDGAIAALTLDVLAECEGYTQKELQALAEAEFFNALFVLPRTAGFMAHIIEQKRNDEGLFRLPDSLLFTRPGDLHEG